MSPINTPRTKRDGIDVPADFAVNLAKRATEAALAKHSMRSRWRKLIWTSSAVAAVFSGILLTQSTHPSHSAPDNIQLSTDEAWSAIEYGDVVLTDDELLELAELHGITSL